MRACIQSVATWFFLVIGGFIVMQLSSIGIGAEPGKRQRISNDQMEIESSSLLERDVRRFIGDHPGVSAERITAYANSALRKHGYLYKFHSCDFIENKKLDSLNPGHDHAAPSVYSLPFNLVKGGRQAFKIPVEDVGPCSYCYALIPAIDVTSHNILAVLDGKKYLLKMPAEFRLEEMELVDAKMKKAIRKWEVPKETYPLGISADGQTLYLPVEFTESDLSANMWLLWRIGKKGYPSSVLAISPTGSHFEVAAKALADQNIEKGRDIPASSDNDNLAIKIFRVKGKTYIIRYPGPCV